MTIDKAKLFQQISAKCGYISEEVTEKIYYALLKVILDELKEHKIIYLPDWGNFKLVEHPAAARDNWWKKGITKMFSAYTQVVFTPCQKLKKYIKK